MPKSTHQWSVSKLLGTRPGHKYVYWAIGNGPFPVDMLRYDLAWPDDSQSVANIAVEGAAAYNNRRTVRLVSHYQPTPGRWKSFGWDLTGTNPELR